jgi:FtsH-binding integral membrane protein
MGVVGIIIAALVNLFLQSGALQFAISVIAVLVFAALTAYDTQRIKDTYCEVAGDMTATNNSGHRHRCRCSWPPIIGARRRTQRGGGSRSYAWLA